LERESRERTHRLSPLPFSRVLDMPGYRGLGGNLSFFQDSLQAPGKPLPALMNQLDWIYASQIFANSSVNGCSQCFGQIANSVLDSQPCLAWTVSGATGNASGPSAFFIPRRVIDTTFLARHFIQATMVSCSIGTGGGINCGLAVAALLNADYSASPGGVSDCSCYRFIVFASDKSFQFTRFNGSAGFSVLASGGAGSVANGDTFRMSWDPSVPGQVTVTVLRNGNAFQQFVDTSGSRLLQGNPVLYAGGALFPTTGTPISEWRNMSCGVGL